jgi:hypothetical protein
MLSFIIEKEDFEVLFSIGATWTFNKYNNIEK